MSRMTPVMWCRIARSSFRQLSVTRRSCCSCFISAFILSTCSVAYAELHETNFLLYYIRSLIYNRPLPYTNLFTKTDICSWTFHQQGGYIPVYNQEQIKCLWQSKKKLENKPIYLDRIGNWARLLSLCKYITSSKDFTISLNISIFFYLQKLKSHFLHLSFQTICVSLLQPVIGWHWSFALPASYCICHLFSWTKQSGIQNK